MTQIDLKSLVIFFSTNAKQVPTGKFGNQILSKELI